MKVDVSEAIKELSTVRDFLRWGLTQFQKSEIYLGHGIDDPWDELVGLVFKTLSLPWDADPAVLDANLLDSEKKDIVEKIRKRVEERIPVAYINNEAWFAGRSFYVDQRVLVPRSPFGEILDNKISLWVEPEEVNRVLDLCTGSGCIAVASAFAFENALVDAVDISKDALEVARINREKHDLLERMNIIESDLFTELEAQYDLILSNPPYVDSGDMAALPEEYLHEPELALRAGHDGLDIVKKILKEAVNYLSKGGVLIVEVGNSEQALNEQFPDVPFLWLEFERGGHGVFLLTRDQLLDINF